MEYYFAHRRTIPVFTENVDVSRWKPLFAISDRDYILKMTNHEFPRGEFYIDCEMLSVSNVLINGEVTYYSISTYTLDFIPTEEGPYYYVYWRNNSAKTYTNENKDGTELFCFEKSSR